MWVVCDVQCYLSRILPALFGVYGKDWERIPGCIKPRVVSVPSTNYWSELHLLLPKWLTNWRIGRLVPLNCWTLYKSHYDTHRKSRNKRHEFFHLCASRTLLKEVVEAVIISRLVSLPTAPTILGVSLQGRLLLLLVVGGLEGRDFYRLKVS